MNMQTTFNSSSSALPSILFWFFLWTLFWLVVLANALARKDFDPITRLTWALVIILVPFFGVLLYFVLAPKQPREPVKDFIDQPTTCVECRTAIPAGATQCLKCGWSYFR
jgi:hypothetical protein